MLHLGEFKLISLSLEYLAVTEIFEKVFEIFVQQTFVALANFDSMVRVDIHKFTNAYQLSLFHVLLYLFVELVSFAHGCQKLVQD